MKPSIRTSKRGRIRNAQFTTIIAWIAIYSLADAGRGRLNVLLAGEEPRRPIDGIMDYSFLNEEAYNQDPGIVQHIFNAVYSIDDLSQPRQRRTDLSFTQEWPAYGQAHQLSYTVPY